MSSYLSDKQLRLILFAPLFFKDVIENSTYQEDHQENDLILAEEIKLQSETINNSIEFAENFLIDMKSKYSVDSKRFLKLINSVNKIIRTCYNLYFDKQTKACKTAKVVATTVFSLQEFFYDICESDENGYFYIDENDCYIVLDSNYHFLKPFANIIITNFVEPLRLLALNTLDLNNKEALIKGKVFNINKFENQCKKNIDIVKDFLKNI